MTISGERQNAIPTQFRRNSRRSVWGQRECFQRLERVDRLILARTITQFGTPASVSDDFAEVPGACAGAAMNAASPRSKGASSQKGVTSGGTKASVLAGLLVIQAGFLAVMGAHGLEAEALRNLQVQPAEERNPPIVSTLLRLLHPGARR